MANFIFCTVKVVSPERNPAKPKHKTTILDHKEDVPMKLFK